MLIEFRVKNFRSLRDENQMSFVAASSDKENLASHAADTQNKSIPHILKSAVIYGPNASGKTNLIRAIEFMRWVVAESVRLQPGIKFPLQPFKLDSAKTNEPTEFEITFLVDGIRYQYGFELTADRILEEWLLVYTKQKPQTWFSRKYNPDSKIDEYEFSSYLKGQRKIWQEATRPNALFLSIAVQLNSDQLIPIFNWIVNDIVILKGGHNPIPDYSLSMLQNNDGKKDIIEFLGDADISIADIDVVSRKGLVKEFKFDATGVTEVRDAEQEMKAPVFFHKTEKGSATFEFDDESEGTKKLFCYAAPILEILANGKLLIVDELDSSLHTLLVRRLVSLFHSQNLNKNGAQLFFSTHDTSLLDLDLFRRDQVWFAEKNSDQATTIYPLTDFSPRKNEALEKGYLMGRYGALPFFQDLKM